MLYVHVFIVCRFDQIQGHHVQRGITFTFPPAHERTYSTWSQRLECHHCPPKSLSKCRMVQIIVKHPLLVTENCSRLTGKLFRVFHWFQVSCPCKNAKPIQEWPYCLKWFTGRLKATMWHFWSTNSLMVKAAVSYRGRIFLSLGHDQQHLRWGVAKHKFVKELVFSIQIFWSLQRNILGSSCNILQHLVGLTSPQADCLLLFSVEWSPPILYSAIEGIEFLLYFWLF